MSASDNRWVSLVPSLTESLFALGAGDEIVGATKFCVHPEKGLRGVQRIGGTKDPKIDRIIALEPTCVFVNEEENRLEDADALRAADVNVHVSYPRRVRDVVPHLRELGEIVGRPSRGQELAGDVAKAIDEASSARGYQPVRFLILIWRKPWMAVSVDTFASDLLAQVGGHNVVADAQGERYPELDLGDIESLAADIVLLPSEPYPFRQDHVAELVAGARIEGSRFVLCDGELLTWHGVRTIQGLLAARRWLAPHRG